MTAHPRGFGALPRAIAWQRPPLYPKQETAIFIAPDHQGRPSRYSFVEASTKAGKAQPLDALVWTPRGPRRMGDLAVGDAVLTPGGASRVAAIHPQGLRQLARITLSDGSSTEADLDHLWEVHEHGRAPKVITTADLMAWPERRLRRAWVPPIAPAALAPQPVPLDPYLVGVLIGDGSMTGSAVRLSSADPEIVEAARAALPAGHHLLPHTGCDWRITAQDGAAQLREDGGHIMGMLRRLGLLCGSHEKRIPALYRHNDEAVRRAVLQGILDADGFVDKHGQPGLEQTSEALAVDVAEVVRSLGGSVLTRLRPVNGYRAKDGAFVQGRPVWRQVIRFPDARWCFRLARKAEKVRAKKRPGHRMFRSIALSRVALAQCIEIADPRHLYLTDDLIPTHNTHACIVWLAEQAFLTGRPGRNYWWVAPVNAQAKIAFRRMKLALPAWVYIANESELFIRLPNGATIWFKNAEKPDNLYGDDVYAAVVDEASRAREGAWHAIRSTLTATKGPLRCIGNVKGRKNWFYKLARQAEAGADDMHFSKLTAWDAVEGGVLDRDEIEDARRLLPEAVFRELYLAEASEDEGNPFGFSHIAACAGPLSAEPPVAIGVDLAKSQDWTVIIGLDRFGAVCGFERWQKVPWGETTDRLADLIGHNPALVDSTGVGDPIVEQLQRRCTGVRGFTFTAASKQRLMEGLAHSIQSRALTFPAGPIRLELEAFEYVYTRTGVRYGAPEGFHDDCVMALALAAQLWREATSHADAPPPIEIPRLSPWLDRAPSALGSRSPLLEGLVP